MDRKLQLEEIDALKSIFYNDEFHVIENRGNEYIEVIFSAHQTLPENFVLKYRENLDSDQYSHVKISYLPPVKLHLILPEEYPSECPPKFTVSCQWLTKPVISKVCEKLDKLWCENENMEIIFIWIDFLRNGLLEYLGITAELDLTELHAFYLKYVLISERKTAGKQSSQEQDIVNETTAVNSGDQCSEINVLKIGNESYDDQKIIHDLSRGQTIMSRTIFNCNTKHKQCVLYGEVEKKKETVIDERAFLCLNLKTSPVGVLVNYNTEREKTDFDKKIFTCSICFTDQTGIECIRFDICNHVFCKNCVSSYFTLQINEGSVLPIKCPESKCSTDVTPLQIKGSVSAEVYTKYDSLLLKYAIDSLEHVIYCPRKFCQYPATKNDENFAICPNCQYVFCVFCRMVYHGIEPCKITNEEIKRLIEIYPNASKEVKQQLELHYGAKRLQNLLNNSMAETWIANNCKNCPHCDVSIEKSYGCNKMVCWKCSTYFCWLCSSILDKNNPYSHFNDDSQCAKKLFYYTPFDPDEELEDYNSDDEQWRDWDWV